MARVLLQKLAVATAGAALYLTTIEANQAFAATFTVTNTNDSGAGSLRQAITEANTTSGANVIDFLLGTGPHEIQLTSGQINISNSPSNSLTINGPGADLLDITQRVVDISINSAFGSRIFYIGGSVDISGLSIVGGFIRFGNGAAIYNGGNLTLTDTIISRNEVLRGLGGGIYNIGTLTVNNSIISDNIAFGLDDNIGKGGGIATLGGTLTVTNSTITGNIGSGTAVSSSMTGGGGIYSESSNITVLNSTLSSNEGLNGGGIYTSGGTLAVTNSTLTDNEGRNGSGIYTNGGTLTVTNSTITGNAAFANLGVGGGIDNNFTATNIKNTIIAKNTALTAPDVSGNFISLGYNLIGNAGSSTGFGAIGDIVGTSAAPIDPKLGPLQNNGGPTQTIALLPGSPAIDAANPNSFPPTDQRGVPRPQGPRADIGAYELQQKVQPVPEPEEETVAFFTVLGLGFLLKKKKAASLSR